MTETYSEMTRKILLETGVMRTDVHVILRSGKHAGIYFNHAALFEARKEGKARELARMMAVKLRSTPATVLVGVETGGEKFADHLAPELARELGRDIVTVPSKKDGDGGFYIPAGEADVIRGEQVLIIEDAVSTDRGAAWMSAQAAEGLGASVLGIRAIVNRGRLTAERYGVKSFNALLEYPVDAFEEADCPLCRAGIPINTDIGHGKTLAAAG